MKCKSNLEDVYTSDKPSTKEWLESNWRRYYTIKGNLLLIKLIIYRLLQTLISLFDRASTWVTHYALLKENNGFIRKQLLPT